MNNSQVSKVPKLPTCSDFVYFVDSAKTGKYAKGVQSHVDIVLCAIIRDFTIPIIKKRN